MFDIWFDKISSEYGWTDKQINELKISRFLKILLTIKQRFNEKLMLDINLTLLPHTEDVKESIDNLKLAYGIETKIGVNKSQEQTFAEMEEFIKNCQSNKVKEVEDNA